MSRVRQKKQKTFAFYRHSSVGWVGKVPLEFNVFQNWNPISQKLLHVSLIILRHISLMESYQVSLRNHIAKHFGQICAKHFGQICANFGRRWAATKISTARNRFVRTKPCGRGRDIAKACLSNTFWNDTGKSKYIYPTQSNSWIMKSWCNERLCCVAVC